MSGSRIAISKLRGGLTWSSGQRICKEEAEWGQPRPKQSQVEKLYLVPIIVEVAKSSLTALPDDEDNGNKEEDTLPAEVDEPVVTEH